MAHIYQGAQGNYYVINGIKYDEHFPQEWANDHKVFEADDFSFETGPERCGNCSFYGSLRGVFVGYCGNCAREYEFKRGRVFCFDYSHEEMWEKLDYMKGVRLAQIGDSEECEYEEPDYKLPEKKISKALQTKQSKKGAQRRKRRELRKRRINGEYVGIPEIPEKDVEDKVFGICMFIVLLSIILIASMSFYLV